MITKYEQYFNKITELVDTIFVSQGYNNRSMAFSHWYLQSMYDMTDQEVSESIVDGKDDNGIDAIICNEDQRTLTVFQFKFPNSCDQLDKEIKQGDIVKTLRGFDILRGKGDVVGVNTKFEEYRNTLKGVFIENFKLVFVSYNNGIISNYEIVEDFKSQFELETGSKMEVEYVDKRIISNLFEKKTRTTSVNANIPYKFCQQAYRTNSINSYIGVLDGVSLVKSIQDKMLTIFDENIRLLEDKSSVNDQIRATASEETSSNMFYFYNNGIVFICDKATNSPNSLSISLDGASIVNGCQTVNSLAKVYSEGKLQNDVSLLFRIIEISDYDERTRITSYLNSQNSIKNSYFIANHSIIRDLQDDLKEFGYYLERQKNERDYKSMFGGTVDEKLVSIKLEDMVQYYAGYWLDDLASTAKRGKGALFETNNINEILKEITAEKVVEAFEVYNTVAIVITKYRKFRRNTLNEEFCTFLEVTNNELSSEINNYLFMNTADILLLNLIRHIKNIYSVNKHYISSEDLIRKAIYISKDCVSKYLKDSAPATLTKKTEIFEECRKKAYSIIQRELSLDKS